MPRVTRNILYRDNALAVRHVATGSRLCVVTFRYWNEYASIDRGGFGEDFLRKRQIDAFHVMSLHNNWYHEPGIFDAVARIAAHVPDYKRVIAYGCSMGGYAAIRFAGLIGAGDVIAISPQFSIDRAVCPFEDRWQDEASRITFNRAIDRAPKLAGDVYTFYDPEEERDRRQVEMIAAEYRVRAVELRGAGHPSIDFMKSRGLLARAVLNVLYGYRF